MLKYKAMKEKEIENIINEIIFTRFISIGTKGICFKEGKNTLIKIFYDRYYNNNEMINYLNKLSKIRNDTYIVPEELLLEDSKLIGYKERYINSKTLKSIRGSIYQFLNGFDKLIQDTKEITDNGLILNDIHSKNILLSDEYHIIDLDNCKIDDNPQYDAFNHNINQILESILYTIFKIDLTEIFYFNSDKLTKLRCKKSNNYNYFYDLIEELIKESQSEDISLIRKRTCYSKMENSYLKPF